MNDKNIVIDIETIVIKYHKMGKSIFEISRILEVNYNLVLQIIEKYLRDSRLEIDFTQLFPEYNEWKSDTNGFTPFDFLGIKSSLDQLILSSKLFFPEVEIKNSILILKGNRTIPQNRESAILLWEKAKDLAEIECFINTFFVELLFPQKKSDDRCEIFINLLRMSWSLYFSLKFPKVNFLFDIFNDEYDGWALSVMQEKSIGKKKLPFESFYEAIQ